MIQRRILAGLAGEPFVGAASRWCQALGSDFGLSDSDRNRIEVCGEELATNVVKYGTSDVAVSVRWVAEIEENQATLVLTDDAPPFDPLSFEVSEIPATLAELELGGRGLQLVREFCDESSYQLRDGSNELTLAFALEQPARAPMRPEGLRDVGIFRQVDESAVDAALGVLTVQDVTDELTILERGDANRSVLLVIDGTLRVYLDRPGGDGVHRDRRRRERGRDVGDRRAAGVRVRAGASRYSAAGGR